MDRFPDEIVDHYDREIDEGQRITRGLRQLELLRTREIVRRHLPPAPRRVLDVGGGTGVHAAWLAADGHDVHLIDRVPRHVDQARRLAPGPGHITAAVGDARDLPAAPASFDAVLLLGPPTTSASGPAGSGSCGRRPGSCVPAGSWSPPPSPGSPRCSTA